MNGIKVINTQPKIQCRVFEDNAGSIELAKAPKMRLKTKQLVIHYHHFRLWAMKGLDGEEPKIQVEYIKTSNQEADIW